MIRPVTAATICFALTPTLFAADEQEVLDAIRKAWQERQDKVKTVKAHLKFKTLQPKGSQITPSGKKYPDEDRWVQEDRWVSFGEGGKIRYAYDTFVWSESDGDFIQSRYNCVTDGKAVKFVNSFGPKLVGGVKRPERFIERQTSSVQQLAAHFRPLDSAYHLFELKDAMVVDVRAKVNDVECVELIVNDVKRGTLVTYFMDPARDYTVLRMTWTMNGKITYLADWTLEKNREVGWSPKTWKVSKSSASGVMITETVTLSIGVNTKLEPSEFEVTFPPRTPVYDEIQRKQYTIPDDGKN